MKKYLTRGMLILVIFTLIISVRIIINENENGKYKYKDGICNTKFNVTIDGVPVSFNEVMGHPVITKTNRTLVPLRIIAENMGYKVDWNQDTKQAYVKGGGVDVTLTINKNTAIVNGKTVPIDIQNGKVMDTKAVLIPVKGSSRTYVPLRFISEATGATVGYDQRDGVHYITITTGGKPVAETGDVITPIFEIIPHNQAGGQDFIIYVDNFMDYKGTDATFSPELISHPEYNFYKYENPWQKGKIEIADVVKTDANQKPNYKSSMFDLYSFGLNSGYAKDIKTGKSLTPPPEGTKMTVKVTIKMNGQEKAFTVDIIRKGFTESYKVEGKPI